MNTQGFLTKNSTIDKKYKILFFIKKGCNAETYRVKGIDRKLSFLKLFNPSQVHRSAFDANGNLLEIEFLKRTRHPNIVGFKDNGEIVVNGKKFLYMVLDFIAGETLTERIIRKPISTVYDIRQILSGVLNGLSYLHTLPEPIIHNEITPQNIMLDLSDEIPHACIIDFGYARSFLQSSKTYSKDGLNLQYVASECITAGIFSPQSDLFSVGVIMYQMIFGMLPWNINHCKLQVTEKSLESANYEKLLEQREKPLLFPNIVGRIVDFDEFVLSVIQKALHPDIEQRFQSAHDFLQALNGEITIDNVGTTQCASSDENSHNYKTHDNSVNHGFSNKRRGFAAIAGMQDLKNMLQIDVIDMIRNPEEYHLHGLSLPNGMLLYGPPGCGKTFFAERFAEETGYNFIKVMASDIASIYIHGTQEKIGKLFNEARKNAPTILYFDELDAMTPDRENTQHNYGLEVNEFLSQLNSIGDSGVFVIGSTNKPQLIDKAVLRAGRLEKHFYVPPPDFDARKAMFELYLKDRPLDFGIDYERLAAMTENYVSSDLRLIADEASRKVIREKTKRISMEILEFIIKNQGPSISLDVFKQYEILKKEMERNNVQKERHRVGFF